MKRQLVPQVLHDELTQYSSLIRALRTNHTLDVTSQLERSFLDNELDYCKATPSSPSSSYRESTPSGSNSQSPSRNNTLDQRRRQDLWTRWPLLVDELPPTEFDLEDEAALLSSYLQKRHQPSTEDLNVELEQSIDVDWVATCTLLYLHRILAAIVITRGDRVAGSLQNRSEPLECWNVLDIVAKATDESIIRNVDRRLKSFVPEPEDTGRLHRVALVTKKRALLDEYQAGGGLTLVEEPILPPPRRPLRPRRGDPS
ncbi:hypothetical protein C8J56DRAFT_926150 [Mycena floridula]|nr:hypothetical protein C8J56DRAFT_926150 [Mycena floridula]